jgi:hypothetical protein
MLDSGLEPVMLDDKTRAVAYYETSQIDLSEVMGDEFGVYTISNARWHNAVTQGPLTDGLNRLLQARDNYDWSDDRFQRAIELYLAMHGMNHQFLTLQGYSQGEWHEVVVYGDYDLKDSIRTLRDWYRGDIYVITLERLHVYTEEATGQTIERWEIEEAIGAVILDDHYTIEECVKDNFGYLMVA